MRSSESVESSGRKPLRLWPAVLIVAVQWLLRFVLPVVAPGAEIFGMSIELAGILAGVVGGLLVLIWWLLLSRAPWLERVAAVAILAAAVLVTLPLLHDSIRYGAMDRLYFVFFLPATASLALVLWAAMSRSLTMPRRLASFAIAAFAACAVWTAVRTNGILGGVADLEWRWTPTAEERLLARGEEPTVPPPPAADEPPPVPAPEPDPAPAPASVPAPAAPSPKAEAPRPAAAKPAVRRAEWPGFRGPQRDAVVHGIRINTDWNASPPVEVWRRPIGPGWSSFAVRGDLLYTQEQRGDDEIVACYRVSTGEPVWRHRDAARFWESNGGPGPRGTPTIHGDRVYAFGATGILNALDARTGKVAWSRNVSKDVKRLVPEWGFTSSPLVIDDVVIVAASGTLAGYELTSGEPRWVGRRLLGSYSSPHRATIDGVEQVVLLTGSGAAGFAPATGEVLWQHQWEGGPPITQPASIGNDLLINTITGTGGIGIRRLALAQDEGKWRVEQKWESMGLKPYFNDFVVHEGHAYGFDGSILSCIDLADGARKWKGGRYGNGQLVLLPEQDLLLVTSEEGELALVSATAAGYKEIAKVPALNGKTWNHPVLVRDLLLVRNGEEMAAFRLPLAP